MGMDVKELIKQLDDPDPVIRQKAAQTLTFAAAPGQDITAAAPALWKVLDDNTDNVKENAAEALAFHYIYKGEWKKIEQLLGHDIDVVRSSTSQVVALFHIDEGEWKRIEKLLKHRNADVAMEAVDVVRDFILNSDSVDKLDEAQKSIENSFREYKRKNQKDEIRIARRKFEYSQLLMHIAQMKAKLSGKDGDLQLGDTVKKPEKGGKVYRKLRQVNRNG